MRCLPTRLSPPGVPAQTSGVRVFILDWKLGGGGGGEEGGWGRGCLIIWTSEVYGLTAQEGFLCVDDLYCNSESVLHHFPKLFGNKKANIMKYHILILAYLMLLNA